MGSLPAFHGFLGLESLDLSYNSLSGDISSQLDGLLVLSTNAFQGSIPTEIGNHLNLTEIDLSHNELSGSIPLSIGSLAKLENLILSGNSLTGNIPTSIVNLTLLSRFVADENQLCGTIPSGITSFVSFLDLSCNKLRGPIPADLLSHPDLQYVYLSYNFLKGSIPENLSSSLIMLRLSSNSLTGSIPSSVASPKSLTHLELYNNSLIGRILMELDATSDNISRIGSLLELQLGENQLGERIPQMSGYLSICLNLSSNLFDGSIPETLSTLKELEVLDLSNNKFSGKIPDILVQMSHPRIQTIYCFTFKWKSRSPEQEQSKDLQRITNQFCGCLDNCCFYDNHNAGSIGYVAPEYGKCLHKKDQLILVFQDGLHLLIFIESTLPFQVMKIIDEDIFIEGGNDIYKECLLSILRIG
ncbi:hypothetical protein Tsubulata_016821, partial [Turnera subulata]